MFMSHLSRLFRLKIILPIVIVAAIVIVLLGRGGSGGGLENTVLVSKGDLVQMVSVTGRVVPARDASLAFERSGKVATVSVRVGDTVSTGQTLVRLENADAVASVLQAEALAKVANAQFAEAQRGSRPEEITLAEVKVKNATQARVDALQRLADSVQQAYTYADDAVRNKADQFFNNPSSNAPQLTIPVSDFQLKTDIQTARYALTSLLTAWKVAVQQGSEEVELIALSNGSVAHLSRVQVFLDKVSIAVNALTANSTLTQTTIDGYKASIAVGRTNVNAATDTLNTAIAALNTADSNVAVAQQELALKKAGSTKEAIAAAQARVAEADAAVLNAQAQLAKTYLTAPFDGVVTRVDAKVGEIAAANTPQIFLISGGEFEIEANIPEADIAKLAVGDQAQTTLDAYGSDVVFVSHVSRIDPAETIVDNVATYKVTLRFASADARIKSGMTANIDVRTEERKDALAVPVRAVQNNTNGEKYVRIVDVVGNVTERTVVTGIRAEGGLIEILSGLSEGERVSLSR